MPALPIVRKKMNTSDGSLKYYYVQGTTRVSKEAYENSMKKPKPKPKKMKGGVEEYQVRNYKIYRILNENLNEVPNGRYSIKGKDILDERNNIDVSAGMDIFKEKFTDILNPKQIGAYDDLPYGRKIKKMEYELIIDNSSSSKLGTCNKDYTLVKRAISFPYAERSAYYGSPPVTVELKKTFTYDMEGDETIGRFNSQNGDPSFLLLRPILPTDLVPLPVLVPSVEVSPEDRKLLDNIIKKK